MSRSRRRPARRSTHAVRHPSRISRPIPTPPPPSLEAAPTGLLDRIRGVLSLDEGTYNAIKLDPGATRQALLIFGLTVLIGMVDRFDRPFVWQLVSPFLAVAGLGLSAWLTAMIGTRLFDTSDGDVPELIRLFGFTAVLGLANPVRFVPVGGPLLNFLIGFWSIVLGVKATRVGLDTDTGRAIAVSLITFLPEITLFLLIYFTFRQWGWA